MNELPDDRDQRKAPQTYLSGAAAAARCQNRKSKQVSFRDGVATTEAVQGRLAPERVDFYSEEVR